MRKLVSALTVPAGLALLVMPAQTEDVPPASAFTISRSAASPGQSIIVMNGDVPPGATVTIALDRSSTVGAKDRPVDIGPAPSRRILDRAVAADDGGFQHSVTIPLGTEPGVYSVVAATDGQNFSAAAPIRVESDGRAVGQRLFLGSGILPGVLAGAGLIVAGGLLLSAIHRRVRIA